MATKGPWDILSPAEVVTHAPDGSYKLQFMSESGPSGIQQLREGITPDMITPKGVEHEPGAIVKASKNRPGVADDYFDVNRSDQLGQGQFAVCYSCKSKADGAVKAVKEIDRSGYTGDADREFDEIVTLLKVDHPQCLGVEEVFVADSMVQIVQAKMDGGNLMLYCMSRSSNWLSEQEAGGCFHQIVKGVAYIHSLCIGHRDLKPENILLAKPGDLMSVQIADFGFAKEFAQGVEGEEGDTGNAGGASTALTSTGLGTFGYVAPEIVARKTRYNGLYVDNWSLGVILWILCVGEAPFKLGGATRADKMKVLKGKYVFGPQWNSLPHPKSIIEKLLVVEPKMRMKSEELLKENWVQNNGTIEHQKSSRSASAPAPTSAPKKGHVNKDKPMAQDTETCNCVLS